MAATDRDLARWALRDDRKLSRTAKLAWLILDSRGEDPHPSMATLAADCGIKTDRNTVRRALLELEARGWLRVEARTAKEGDADTNRYVLLNGAGHEGVGCTMHPPWVHGAPGVGAPDHPKDQREDQPEDQQDSSLRPRRRAAEQIVTAYLGAWSGLYDDAQVIVYLQRTFRSHMHRDVAAFARYLLRLYQAAPEAMAEIAELKAADQHGFIAEVQEPLQEARAAARGHRLSGAEQENCRMLADWAESVAAPGMTAEEASSIGAARADADRRARLADGMTSGKEASR